MWTIPLVLRPTFRRDQRLLGELARCAWKTLLDYTRIQSLDRAAVAGAIVVIQYPPISGAPVSPGRDSYTGPKPDRSGIAPTRG